MPASQTPPLIEAVKNKDLARAKELLDQGADIQALDGTGCNALLHAIRSHAPDVARMLVRNDIRIDVVCPRTGKTALHLICIKSTWRDELDMLLLCRPPLDIADHAGQTPLSIAINNIDEWTTCQLIKAGADPDLPMPAGDNRTIRQALGSFSSRPLREALKAADKKRAEAAAEKALAEAPLRAKALDAAAREATVLSHPVQSARRVAFRPRTRLPSP